MKFLVSAVALLFVSLLSQGVAAAAGPTDPTGQFCLPPWGREALLHEGFTVRMALVDILARPVDGACAVAPWFAEGDFNGDGKTDIAVRGRNRMSDTYGILVVHNGEWKVYGIGFPGGDATGEGKSYRLCHLRAQRGSDGRDDLVVTPFKQESDIWRWSGSTYTRIEKSKP